MNTFDNIDFLLKKNHKRQIDLTNYLGVQKATYTGWKSGRTKSYTKYLTQIADFFDVSVDYLLGETDISERPTIKNIAERGTFNVGDVPKDMKEYSVDKEKLPNFEPIPFSNGGVMFLGSPKVYTIPVYNSLVAAFGRDLNEGIIDYRFVTLPTSEDAAKTIFATVNDNSMAPKIEDGDLVQIYKTDVVESGTVAVVIVDGRDISIRRVIYGHGWTELQATMFQYGVTRFEKEEIDRIRILGRITETISVSKNE